MDQLWTIFNTESQAIQGANDAASHDEKGDGKNNITDIDSRLAGKCSGKEADMKESGEELIKCDKPTDGSLNGYTIAEPVMGGKKDGTEAKKKKKQRPGYETRIDEEDKPKKRKKLNAGLEKRSKKLKLTELKSSDSPGDSSKHKKKRHKISM